MNLNDPSYRFPVIGGRPPALLLIALFVLYFLIAAGFQFSMNAPDAPFLAFPDEPSHFVSAVMVHDYLLSAHFSSPIKFARDYYEKYPFFAIGHWPPLSHLMTALGFMVFGLGRTQALLFSAFAAAGSAAAIAYLAHRRVGWLLSGCAGLLYLSLPEVRFWICAVMVDQTVTLFCLLSVVFLLRYLDRARSFDILLCSGFAVCATFTKYSGAFVGAVPLIAVICLRRFDLLRRPAFLVYPLIIAVPLPWILWTLPYAVGGLPDQPPGPIRELLGFILQTWRAFPVLLGVALLVGWLVLMILRASWTQDVVVISLFCLGQVVSLVTAKVDIDRRFLMPATAGLIVLGIFGWAALAERAFPSGLPRLHFAPLAMSVALAYCFWQFRSQTPAPHSAMRDVVANITRNATLDGDLILVAPDREGPLIAEFAQLDRHRPGYTLVRPSKAFSSQDWRGGHYRPLVDSPEEMLADVQKRGIDLILWHDCPKSAGPPHVAAMKQMLSGYAQLWRPMAYLPASTDDPCTWTTYRYSR